MYPQQTFTDFTQLLNYINTEVVTNGNEEIDAIIMNNVVNGLLTFIEQSPLNSPKGTIVSSGGNVVLNSPVTLISGTTPINVTWGNNIYNQYVIINSLSVPVTTLVSFKDILGNVINSIPPQSVLNLYQLSNGDWVNTNRNIKTYPLQIVVGYPDSDGNILMDNTTISLTINQTGVQVGSVKVFNGMLMPLDATGVTSASYGVVYLNSKIVVNFVQPFDDGQVVVVEYTFFT